MTTRLSLTPLFRHSVGFDRFNDFFENVFLKEDGNNGGYPPYNIEKQGEDRYYITMAVAGFKESDIDISVKRDTLTVTGRIEDKADESIEFLHRGIATRAFERQFRLADHVEVNGAELKHGLLRIELKRELPKEEQLRRIKIN